MSHLRKYWLVLVLAIYLPNLIFILYFALSPLSFYFREWEYFTDLGYKGYFPMVWKGEHHGDQSRKYFFHYQETRPIVSSVDQYGFRIPFHRAGSPAVENYPIVIVGKSFAYGSSLDDSETFHWRLSEELNIPVYNLSRSQLHTGLNHPLLKKAKVIVEIIDENAINKSFIWTDIKLQDFTHPRVLTGTWFGTLSSVPAERYLFHSVLLRRLNALGLELYTWIKNDYSFPKYLFNDVEYQEADMNAAVSVIAAKSKNLKSLGLDYYFIPIPRKQAFYRPETSEYMKSYTTNVVKKLEALGVQTVDVTPYFKETLKTDALYTPADTHWTPAAVEAAQKAFLLKFGEKIKQSSVL